MIVVMLPCFLMAMYEKHGQPLETVVKNIIQTKFVRPKERPYQTQNLYAVLERQRKLEKGGISDCQRNQPKAAHREKPRTKAKRKLTRSERNRSPPQSDRQRGRKGAHRPADNPLTSTCTRTGYAG